MIKLVGTVISTMNIVTSILIIVFTFLFSAQNVTYAQSPPTKSPPIQRTIEEEGAQTFSDPISAGSGSSNNTAVYGLLATGLVLIAAGAVYMLWANSASKSASKNE